MLTKDEVIEELVKSISMYENFYELDDFRSAQKEEKRIRMYEKKLIKEFGVNETEIEDWEKNAQHISHEQEIEFYNYINEYN